MAQEVLARIKQVEKRSKDAVGQAKEEADAILKKAEQDIRAEFESLTERGEVELRAARAKAEVQAKTNTAIYKEETARKEAELTERLVARKQGAVDIAIAALME
ncbi:MAG: hypothetical protein ACOYJB_05920 [Christensenellaceae bacterium]|jgi:vacuolar-type H+-ATPase subunit H